MSLGSSPSCGSTATCTTTGPPATRSVRTRSSTSASPRSSTGSYSTPASSRGRPRWLCRDPPAAAGPAGSAHGRIARAGGDRGRLGAGAGSAGPTRGARVRRLGDARDALAVTSRGPRQAHLEGFDLHANVWVSANDRAGVERLCRYVLRPPFAQERLRLRSDGRIALELKTAWHDGTRELVFEPLELLERLAALTPRPETNLLICHGVLSPRARWRERVVAYGRVAPEPTASTAPLAAGPEGVKAKSGSRAWSWAALMHRAFVHPINCNSRRGGDRARPGHASLPS